MARSLSKVAALTKLTDMGSRSSTFRSKEDVGSTDSILKTSLVPTDRLTPRTPIMQRGAADPPVEETPLVQWRIYWRKPAIMIGLFVLGLISAVSHHAYYRSLNGTQVRTKGDGHPRSTTQQWIINYGVAFAFLTQVLLASSISMAYTQQIWVYFRQRAYKVSTVDVMFTATSNFFAFRHKEFVWKAKKAALLAAIFWWIPLSAVIAPSSLLVVDSTYNKTTIMRVPSINFTDPMVYLANGMPGDVHPLLMRTTIATASRMEILSMRAASPNSTYSMVLNGTSLKCEKASGVALGLLDRVNKTIEKELGSVKRLNLKMSVDYQAFIPTPNACQGCTAYNASKSTKNWNVTTLLNDCVKDPSGSGCSFGFDFVAALLAAVNNERLSCNIQRTRYDIRFHSVNDLQNVASYKYEQIGQLQDFDMALNVVMPIFHALANVVSGAILVGYGQSRSGNAKDFYAQSYGTRILETGLIGAVKGLTYSEPRYQLHFNEEFLAKNKTLAQLIEELSVNQTLSLFSDPRFWTDEDKSPAVNVTRTYTHNIWQYKPMNLWLAYGIAIGATLFAVLLGLRALYVNGVCHHNGFASIVATTRNNSFDKLTLGYSLGSLPLDRSLLESKIRFGVLNHSIGTGYKEDQINGDSREARAGFGLVGEVSALKPRQAIS